METRWKCTAIGCDAEASTGWVTSNRLLRLICGRHLDQLADGALGISTDDGGLMVKPLAQAS